MSAGISSYLIICLICLILVFWFFIQNDFNDTWLGYLIFSSDETLPFLLSLNNKFVIFERIWTRI